MTDYVLTGLVKRRAEVTGEIEAIHERLKVLLASLEAWTPPFSNSTRSTAWRRSGRAPSAHPRTGATGGR